MNVQICQRSLTRMGVWCVLMRRHHLKRAFAFDQHFQDMGFSIQ